MPRSVALVVQRYGSDLVGGSETLARAYAERLIGRGFAITVYTTTARDYVTWRSEYPAGESAENGVRILRFAPERERDLQAFNALAEPMYTRPTTAEDERAFLEAQGPLTPALVDALRSDLGRYEAVLFLTYLYYPTVEGIRVAGDKAVFIPTAHDEPPLRFGMFKRVFEGVRSYAFCSAPEARLVASRFDLSRCSQDVVGIGVDPPEPTDVEEYRILRGIERPYLLYAGRIDAGKGCDEMLRFYERAQAEIMGCPDLHLIGKLAMELPRIPRLRHLGFVSEADKRAAMAGAEALICPSPYESLSITLLEAMSQGTPVLASSRSDVLVDHCLKSQAGLVYGDPEEFTETVRRLVLDEPLRRALGRNGERYALTEFSWESVLDRLVRQIDAASRS
ncbi:MAG: glycosyltransferase family 4 protein [Vicinamibacteria bacterium]|jgi:glycosyltransferase involved in cell wall biosynthesis|nr:glycosyltransferase family 4 protein [Vicinamibacteria bacterium]